MAEQDPSVSSMRATAHPVRLQILSLLTGTEMSAAELARELDLTHANASYHLRLLAEAGMVVEAGEERIRGGVAKRYRHPWDVAEAGPAGTPEEAEQYVRTMTSELLRRHAHRRRGGTPALLTDAEMWVRPEVWARVHEQVKQASFLLHAEAQRPRTPGTVHVNLTVAAFGMAGDAAEPESASEPEPEPEPEDEAEPEPGPAAEAGDPS